MRRTADRPLRYADIGTGSGCIGLSVALHLDGAGIPYVATLTDRSPEALSYARKNHENLAPAGTVRLEVCDLYPEGETDTLDMVLSNPPYIVRNELDCLMPEVSRYEPRTALDGGPDGLDLIRRVAEKAAGLLRDGGWLLLEHGYGPG